MDFPINRPTFHTPMDSYEGQIGKSDQTEKDLLDAAVDLLRRIQEPETLPADWPLSEPQEKNPDLFTLLGGLTALRQEVSLQGRSFHQLEQTIKQWIEQSQNESSLGEFKATIENQIAQIQETADKFVSRCSDKEKATGFQDGYNQAFNDLIKPLLDTHDQFRRLDEQYQRRPIKKPGWLRSLFRKKCENDIQQNIELTLKKINQRLDSIGVAPCVQVGMIFNAQTMKAVDLETGTSDPPNTVLEIYQQGYMYKDRILRFAEVKVASAS